MSGNRAEAAERAAVREAAIRTKARAASKIESVQMLYAGRTPPRRSDPEELVVDIAKRTRLDDWGDVPLLFGFVPTRVVGSKATPNAETFAGLRFAGESLIAAVKAGDAAGVSLALPHTKRAVYDPHPKVHADAVARHVDARCDNAAAVNWRDSHGFTALHWACQRGHARIALRLLAIGASENGRFANGTTPLQIGRMHGRSEGLEVQMRRIVAQRLPIDRRLLVAAAHGNADEILALLRGNHPLCALDPDAIEVAQVGAAPVLCAAVNAAEPQKRCGGGETALHEAAFFGRNAACGVLLRSGAWVDARCCLGWTALHRACAEGHESTARLLIEAAAAAVDFGALRGAVLPGAAKPKAKVGTDSEGAAGGAADRGADRTFAEGLGDDARRRTALCAFVDAKTRMGETALQLVCANCAPIPFVRYLVETGASPTAVDVQGRSALHCVALSAADPTLKMAPLHLATYIATLPGVEIAARDSILGETALHIAARSGHLKLCQFLTKKGADVFARNANGQTPLAVAKAWGRRAGREQDEEHDHELLISWLEMLG